MRGIDGERSLSASVSSAIARPVASTAASWSARRSFATFNQASAASKGRARSSQTRARFANTSGLSPAIFFKLRKVVSAFPSRHSRAAFSAMSNSKRQVAFSGQVSNGTRARRAAGTPAEPTTEASMCRSSAVPIPASVSHSTIPWAKPDWPVCAATCTRVAAIPSISGPISAPAASRALSNSAAASWIRPLIASANDAWPRARGLAGNAARNSAAPVAASANFRVANWSFVRVARRQARPGVLVS